MSRITGLLRNHAREWLRTIEADERRRRSPMRPATELGERQLRNTRTLPDREALLRALPRHAVVAELGVDEGHFSEQILELAQPETLHLVDPWCSDRFGEQKARAVRERFAAPLGAGRVAIHRGRSSEILESFPDGSFDWIYIDTDHSYPTTAAELRLGRRKLKPGGILAGHDYVTGSWDGGVRYGVVEAVHEFCVHEDWELVYLTAETHRHLSFALRESGADGARVSRAVAPSAPR